MRCVIDKDIIAIKECDGSNGTRIAINIPPDEMKKRKEEIIHNLLEKFISRWDIVLNEEGSTPTPCRDLDGFWSYFVKFN